MSQHSIRCRKTGEPLGGYVLDGGTCKCPEGRCLLEEEKQVQADKDARNLANEGASFGRAWKKQMMGDRPTHPWSPILSKESSMTVKQLITELQKHDPDLLVYVHHPHEFWGEAERLEICEPIMGVGYYPRRLEISTA